MTVTIQIISHKHFFLRKPQKTHTAKIIKYIGNDKERATSEQYQKNTKCCFYESKNK